MCCKSILFIWVAFGTKVRSLWFAIFEGATERPPNMMREATGHLMSILAYFMTASENKTDKIIHSSDTLDDDDTDKEEEDIDQAKGMANNVGDEEWKPREEAHGLALCANSVAQPIR